MQVFRRVGVFLVAVGMMIPSQNCRQSTPPTAEEARRFIDGWMAHYRKMRQKAPAA